MFSKMCQSINICFLSKTSEKASLMKVSFTLIFVLSNFLIYKTWSKVTLLKKVGGCWEIFWMVELTESNTVNAEVSFPRNKSDESIDTLGYSPIKPVSDIDKRDYHKGKLNQVYPQVMILMNIQKWLKKN